MPNTKRLIEISACYQCYHVRKVAGKAMDIFEVCELTGSEMRLDMEMLKDCPLPKVVY